jgi:phosphoadenosine phosphosulfate reductase
VGFFRLTPYLESSSEDTEALVTHTGGYITFTTPLSSQSRSYPSKLTLSTMSITETQEGILQPQFTPDQIDQFNAELDGKTPQEILVWAIDNVQGLYQTTAFGL